MLLARGRNFDASVSLVADPSRISASDGLVAPCNKEARTHAAIDTTCLIQDILALGYSIVSRLDDI